MPPTIIPQIGEHVVFLDFDYIAKETQERDALVIGVRTDLSDEHLGSTGQAAVNLVLVATDQQKRNFLDSGDFYLGLEVKRSVLHASNDEKAGKALMNCWLYPDEYDEIMNLHHGRTSDAEAAETAKTVPADQEEEKEEK